VIKVVAGVIARGDRVLLTQRSPSRDYPMHWECPGGKIEQGEGPRQALRRELAEEIGLLDVGVERMPFFETALVLEGKVVVLAFYRVEASAVWRPMLKDVEGAGWFTRQEMLGLLLIPGNVRLLEHLEEAA
jgi:8-oxo-dGTP diphosphatase